MGKQHYFLLAGEVVTESKAGDDVMHTRLNGVLESPSKNFPVSMLGKGQQLLQHLFYQRTGEIERKVIDVFTYNVSYLGYMTSKEFNDLSPEMAANAESNITPKKPNPTPESSKAVEDPFAVKQVS